MSHDLYTRMRGIVLEAARTPPTKRESFLDSACLGDDSLRQQVEALLALDAGATTKSMTTVWIGRSAQPPHTPTSQSGDELAGRYRISAYIGHGGMAEVYRALDQELGIDVALKTIRPEIAEHPAELRRFKQEVLLARSVAHPNVCRTFDLGHHRDDRRSVFFLTMEFLRGETLASRIARRGRLSREETLHVFRGLAAALDAAHAARIVHRDLKSSNIMLVRDGGKERVVVTDFGIALATGHLVTVDEGKETRTEDTRSSIAIVGTPSYMAPEQVLGIPVGPEADRYALGVVLFETLTGRRPFEAASVEATMHARLVRDPPRPSALVSIEPAAESVVLQLLSRDPAQRFASARDALRAFEGLPRGSSSEGDAAEAVGPAPARSPWSRAIRVIAPLLITLMIVVWWLVPGVRGPSAPGLLILPMTAVNMEADSDYIGRAFSEALVAQLGDVDGVSVRQVPGVSELASMASSPLGEIAARFSSERVVRGSLTGRGDVIEASLTLLDAVTDSVLWARADEDEPERLTALAQRLAADLAVELGASVPERYDYWPYLAGGSEMASSLELAQLRGAFGRGDFAAALGFSKALVEQFPEEADAWALHAYMTYSGMEFGVADRQMLDEALDAVDRVDARHPTAECIRCEFLNGEGKTEESIARTSALVERRDLTPAAKAWALRIKASAKAVNDDLRGAQRDVELALRLDPTTHYNFKIQGWIEEARGDLEQAESAFRKGVAIAWHAPAMHNALARVLGRLERWREAAVYFQRAYELLPDCEACAKVAHAYARADDVASSSAWIAEADSLCGASSDLGGMGAFMLGQAYALDERMPRAVELFRLARTRGVPSQAFLALSEDPELASLWNEPGFRELTEEIPRESETDGGPVD